MTGDHRIAYLHPFNGHAIMKNLSTSLASLSLCLFVNNAAVAQASCAAKSTAPQTLPLVMLFTSEGCSSCPPADKWASELKRSNKAIVLGFHVDYWDYIGWKDKYASKQYTALQRRFSTFNRLSHVYTPQVLLQGKDTPSWWRKNPEQTAADLPRAEGTSLLPRALNASVQGSNIAVTLQNSAQQSAQYELYLALLEDNIQTKVRAGENRGELLRHDGVVRALIGPLTLKASEQLVPIDLPTDAKPSDLSVVAFAINAQTGAAPLAVSQRLCSTP
jgi:hypothetical protein